MIQIEDLQPILTASEILTELAQFPGTQVPYLLLGPEADPAYRDQTLQLSEARVGSLVFINDLLRSIGQPVSAIDQLQLTLTLPFTVPPTRVRELAQCMAAFNQRLQLGNFGMNGQNLAYFRYHWLVFERQFSSKSLLTAIRLAYQQCSDFGPRLEALASGQIQLASAID